MAARRSNLVIFVIGLVGFGSLAFIMKFSLQSSPGLLAIGKLKQVLAKEFAANEIDEVSVRLLPRKEGYRLRVSCAVTPEGAEPLLESLARRFVALFEGPVRRRLEVEVARAAGFGCGGSVPVAERAFSMPDLLAEFRMRQRFTELVGRKDRRGALEVAQALFVDLERARFEIRLLAAPPGEDDEDAKALAFSQAQSFAWQLLQGTPVRWLELVLRSSAAAPAPGDAEGAQTEAAVIEEAILENPILRAGGAGSGGERSSSPREPEPSPDGS